MNRYGVAIACRFVVILALFCAAETRLRGDDDTTDAGVQKNTVQRTVLFRDGSVLRMSMPDEPLPWRRISPDGQVLEAPLPYGQISQLVLVTTPATEQVANVRRMIAALADEDFQERVEAQRDLVERGAQFRTILETSLELTKDFEARWRLKEVLNVLPTDKASIKADYDVLTIGDSGEETHGDVGDWSVDMPYRGGKVRLDRASVRALHAAALEFSVTAEAPLAIVERITDDRDDLFPKEVQRIDFERGPQGETINVGDDIRRTYLSQGVSFASALEGSFVSIEPYNVGGRSGGRCAATHRPLYQGTMVIRFCLPGNERAPGGVRYVGFWTSHIAPDGTSLEAYDVRGRRIAAIKTVRTQREFLALKSNTPIASIRIVPNEEVDPDFAIDDLVFDTPKPLAEAGDAEHYTVVLTTGERMHCDTLEPGDNVTLKGVTVGIDRLEIPVEQVAIVVPPKNPTLVAALPDSGFVRLSDGSILRCRGGRRLAALRFPEIEIADAEVVALWGGETTLTDPEDVEWPDDAALLIDDGEARPLSGLRLGEKWLTGQLPSELAEKEFSYENSPLVWLERPRPRRDGSGLLRLVSGDEVVLAPPGGASGFSLVDWSGDGATIARGKQQWTIPPGEIGSLLLPGAARRKK